jgi:hypothetical protein
MEYELEEVERDNIEFRKEMGEYNIEMVKSSISMLIVDTINFFQLKGEYLFQSQWILSMLDVHGHGNMT